MRAQIRVAKLVARMADDSQLVREDFARENVIRPLVTILSFDLFIEDPKLKFGKQSIHLSTNIYKPGMGSSPLHTHYSVRGNHLNERENEKPEVILMVKISCAEALWMLARGIVLNSRRISETKGLLFLSKLVETEEGEFLSNCLMTIMEITAAADSNADLRRETFKTNSPAAKAVVGQLLKVINDSFQPTLQFSAIRAIGYLARTFPARETRVTGPLVIQLSQQESGRATEAAVYL